MDSFIGGVDDDSVEVVTNAGRAYIRGFRHQRDLPTATLVPKSVAVKSVRGEQKTFDINKRRYAVNSTPLKETTQVEAIVEITRNVTRGSVGGGEDLLTPNPVVDILEVSQGATIFQEDAVLPLAMAQPGASRVDPPERNCYDQRTQKCHRKQFAPVAGIRKTHEPPRGR